MDSKQDFWVIGIGASAGGLEALSAFFKNLPENPPASFVVCQHLAPHAKSMMVELISRQTSLTVVPAKNKVRVKRGVVYIVPPNHDVTIHDFELRLTEAGEETRPKPSVDHFFTSLGKNFGKTATGIILSGTGSDGTEGIRAIKEAGGVTLVQDPGSAKYDGMPKSAMDTGLVDAVLTPERLAGELLTFLAGDGSKEKTFTKEETGDFQKILKFLKDEIGSDFSQYKISTVQRRIEKRLGVLGIKSIPDYFVYLKETPSELQALSQNMLVSVTAFFRDSEAYDHLSHHIEEMIAKKSLGEELRFWSAGCATGEEPYSLAMIVADLCEKHRKPLNVKIFATDLDLEALNTARNATYSSEDVAGVPQEFLAKYFEKKNTSYELRKFIRDMIVFARQDLIQHAPFVKLDLVTCRNVLIYFEPSLQSRVFEIFHYALRPSGILFLGKSESAQNSLFETVDKKEKIFRRLNVLTNISPRPMRHQVGTNFTNTGVPRKKPSEIDIVAQEAPVLLLKTLGVSGVVVDEDGAIVHLLGDVSNYIDFPKGQADFRIQNLLPKGVSLEFNVLLRKAKRDTEARKSRPLRFGTSPDRMFSLSVVPLELGDGSRDLYLLVFEPYRVNPAGNPDGDSPTPADGDQRLQELEDDLAVTRQNLQTVIEELEISNEELQSLNEELSSTNEELQASNEELETTNEELQSTNEELMTLNEELSVKSTELRQAYLNLENIQTSIGAPVVVIDNELRLLRYNAASSSIFQFSPQDLHQPITRASCQCEIPQFEKVLKDTIRTGEPGEVICHTNQQVFQLRIHPSRDEHRKIVGAILIFFDNTDFIQARETIEVSEKRIRSIIDNSPTLVTLKDNVGKYLSVNRAFLDFYNLREDQVIGKTDRDIFPEELASEMRDNDLEVLLRRESRTGRERVSFRGEDYFFHVNRFPLFGKNERNPYAVGSVSLNITVEEKSQELLRASESRYRAMIEEQAVFVVRHQPNGNLTFGNGFFHAYFGLIPGEKKDRSFYDFVSQGDRKRVKAEIQKISYLSPTVQVEHRAQSSRDPGVRWVRWIHRGIFSDEGQLLEYQSVGFDVTDIHIQTADLLAKESLYTHVLEHTSDYLSVYRQEGGEFFLENFSQSTAKGPVSLQRIVGKRLSDLFDASTEKSMVDKFQKALSSESIMSFEEEIEGPKGTLFLSTVIVPVAETEDGSSRVVTLSRDITKLKRTERALRDEMSNAEAANRAKSEFLASMSHELRTPLNVIMGMGQLLARGDLSTQQQKLIESIQRSSKVLLTLIEDVLDLSKIEAGKISFESQVLSLDHLTQDTVLSFETEAKRKGLKLEREFKLDSDVSVLGDAVRLRQVLNNLLGNALKFTETGSVKLLVRLESLSPEIASVYFEVSDTGIGISRSAFPKIFKRFSQADSSTSRRFGGTGLGLAISKQLVELMNGQIGFESEEGKGSTFWFKVQFPRSAKSHPGVDVLPESELDFSTIKILAVDDNPESLRFLQLYFEDNGGKLLTAESGKEALTLIHKETFDLILMDMQMPEMDGLETTRRIRNIGNIKKRTPVIALTANAMPGDKEMCLEAGMNDYLTKPIDLEELKKLLRKWL